MSDANLPHRRIADRPVAIACVFVPIAHYLGTRAGALFTAIPEGISILWPPNSILLAALLLLDGRGLLPLTLLVLLAGTLADAAVFPMQEALLFSAINTGEAVLAFALLRRWRFDRRASTLADLWKFLLAGPIVAAFVAAVLSSVVYNRLPTSDAPWLESFFVWWFGNALGLLVFTPLLLSLAQSRQRFAERWREIGAADVGVLVAAALALAAFVAGSHGRLLGMPMQATLLLPFAIAVAARFGLAVSASTAAIMAIAVVLETTTGQSPFRATDMREEAFRAQEFVFILAVMTIGLAALLEQLRARQRDAELAKARLEDVNERLEAHVHEKTEQLEALNRGLRELASIDPLTGIANRRAFFERGHREFDNSVRYGMPLSLLMLDLDHFKRVNDRYGHQAGDQVLRQVATWIVEMLRSGDLGARYGGEEFVVLAPHTGLHDAATLAARIKERISRCAIVYDRKALHVTISIGVASRIDGDANLQALLRRADAALYDAKRAGRDRVALADVTEGSPVG